MLSPRWRGSLGLWDGTASPGAALCFAKCRPGVLCAWAPRGAGSFLKQVQGPSPGEYTGKYLNTCEPSDGGWFLL